MEDTKELSTVLVMEKPSLDKNGMIVIQSNFAQVKSALSAKLEPYTKMELTDASIEAVNLVKKELRDLRMVTEKTCKEYMASYFNLPVNTVKAQSKDVLSAIDEAESHIDALLSAHDQKRIKALDAVYAEYEKEALREYSLPEGAVDFALTKEFYLKGAGKNQSVLKDNIFAQAKAVRDAADKKARDINAVRTYCPATFNAEPYIALLEHEDVSEVIAQIQRDMAPKEAHVQEAQEDEDMSFVKEETKNVLKLRVAYQKRMRDIVESAVRSLKDAGVSVTLLK